MDWKDLSGIIGSAAPVLGGLIGGPAGAAVGSIVASALGTGNTPDEVHAALIANPDAAVKLRQIEADQATRLRELAVTAENNRLIADTAAIASVNTTMQVEAKSDHWPTYAWRPSIGFAFSFNLVMASLIVLGVFAAQVFAAPGADKAVAALPATLGSLAAISGLATPILGVASWFRGKMQADPRVPTDNRG